MESGEAPSELWPPRAPGSAATAVLLQPRMVSVVSVPPWSQSGSVQDDPRGWGWRQRNRLGPKGNCASPLSAPLPSGP